MGVRTGKPRGRPKGSPNKRTVERVEAMAETARAIGAALPEAFAGDAHSLLVAIYKDVTRPIELRIDAAKAAIRYETPALAAVELSGGLAFSHEDALAELDEPEGTGDPAPAEIGL